MTVVVSAIFRLRRDTAANWASANPVLSLAEPGLETDTRKVKYGDGTTAWNSLGYSTIGGIAASAVTNTPAGNIAATDVQAALNELDTEKLAKASNLSDLASATTARTNLGLAIGTDVQAYDPDLATIAGLTATTDNFIVAVSSAWASRTPAQVRTTLGLVVGTNVQAWDGDLDALAALTGTNTIYYRSAANTWTAVTIGGNLSFSGGTLNGQAGTVTSVSGTSNEISVATGTTTPVLSLPATLTFTSKTVTGGTFSGPTLSGTTTLPGSGSITSGGRILAKAASGNYHTLAENNTGDYAALVRNDHATDGFGLLITSASASATTWEFITGYSSGTSSKRFAIQGNGNMLNVNGVYGTLSDRRIKCDIRPANPQWDDVYALSHAMSTFALRDDPAGLRQLGAIAQDWEKISPGLIEFVPETKIGNGGRPVRSGRKLRTIKTSVAMMKLFKAAGEMMDRIVTLEQEIAALKADGSMRG